MISIEIKELKKFLTAARNIRDRNILPILSYVKLECKDGKATLTKTNLDSFVVCEVEASFTKDCVILIDEKTISSTVSYSPSSILNISVVDGNVIMEDGHGTDRCKVEDPKLFPSTESTKDLKEYTIDSDMLEALDIARNHTLQSVEKMQWECFVHVIKVGNKTLIGASNQFVLYLKMFSLDIPAMVLPPETINAISSLSYVDYSSSERYDFFKSQDITYGFIKSITAKPALNFLWDKLTVDAPIEISRKELVKFCEKVISMNGSSILPEVYIKGHSDGVEICFDAASDAQGSKQVIKAKGDGSAFPETRFQPKYLIIAMKDLGTDTVKLSKMSGNIVITSTDDKDYKGTIMELAKLN